MTRVRDLFFDDVLLSIPKIVQGLTLVSIAGSIILTMVIAAILIAGASLSMIPTWAYVVYVGPLLIFAACIVAYYEGLKSQLQSREGVKP